MKALGLTGLLALALAGLLCLAVLMGHRWFDPLELIQGALSPQDHYIAFELRLPRALMAIVVGASLASCGLLLQSCLHNPLAAPFTLGTSAGASLGTLAVLIAFGAQVFVGVQVMGALIGAVVVSMPVIVLALRRQVPPEAVLLTGVAVGLAVAALVSAANYVSAASTLFAYVRWSLGSLSTVGFNEALLLLVPCLLPVVACWALRYRLDAMLAGEELACARGVDVRGVRVVAIGAVMVSVAVSVAVCGPIGFVGLVTPHIARGLCGATVAQRALPNALLGAILLLVCDMLGRSLLAFEIPIGVVTALFGTPAFLVLLLRRFRREA